MKIARTLLGLCALAVLTGCSNLFENIYNADGSQKTGDSSLTTSGASSNTDITSGLVVIKASAPTVNQITYSEEQTTYYVGSLPDGYSDDSFSDIGFTNGTDVQLLAKDDPVEFRCYKNDENATVSWSAEQTWRYIPEVQVVSTTDSDGNEVTYSSVVSETAEALSESVSVNVFSVSDGDASRVQADIPYGVTVVTCTITADDEQYSSTYRIIVTKSFITTVANTDTASKNVNTVTDHGLVVIKATQPSLNAINYSSTTYEYEVGDSTGADTTGDLIGRDDPVIFKCYLLDENATLSWKAKQTKKYALTYDEETGGITGQELTDLDEEIDFDWTGYGETHTGTTPYLQQTAADSYTVISSNLPYGVTEVYAVITAQNTTIDGELVTDTTQYKITLTKRYIITTATTESLESMSGLGVYANGTVNSIASGTNLISYSASKRNYTVTGLNGGDDPIMVTFKPEEPENTTFTWTATQTQVYETTTATYSTTVDGEAVTYTYQTGGTFTDCDEVDLLANGTLAVSCPVSGQGIELCAGDLPYGTTVVTVTVDSTADPESAGNENTYTVTLKKKQVTTSANIVSDDNTNISLVTDSGLVVISAQEPNVNQISFSADTLDYSVDGITSADNDMDFRCFLADTDATVTWSVVQTKTFTAVTETTTEEVTDSLLGTTTTVTTTTVTGQTEEDAANEIEYTVDENYSDNQAITATIPYGVTVVTATVSADGEADTVYTITLTHNIYESGSSTSTESSYSLLSELDVSISGDETTEATLSPEFSPTVTIYTLTVDADADSITIDATAASEDAVISTPVSITKYGTVPNISGTTVPLVGGTSKITFTVTDETGVSRTYTIYVIKTADGDTSLSALDCTPASSFDNGVAGYTFDSTYTGESAAGTAKYAMTLSADSRVDVTSIDFTAVPTNKRTTVSYGYSTGVSTLPSDEDWSDSYTYATQTGSSPVSYTVAVGDEDAATITRVLWVKTVSDSYYHYDSTNKVYETTKRSDTTYHAVKITKAGDANQNLTALTVIATYEDGSTKTILTQTTASTVAYTTTAASTSVTTYADRLDFYFRPLDKDESVTYTAVNSAYDTNSEENTTFTGYAASAVSLTEESGDYFDDGASSYYHFTLGEIAKGTGITAQTADLPNGTTKVTICGITYSFVKPKLSDTSYSVSGWSGTGSGIDTSSRTSYIYVTNDTESVVLSLNVTQQNASVSVYSIEQTADANDATPESASTASYAVLHKDATDSIVSNAWKISVGNASYEADGYTRTAPETVPDESTVIPVGTTKLVLYVENNGTQKDYTYYIVRASDSEARLKTLTLTNPDESAKTANLEPSSFSTGWESVTDGATYVLSSTAYTLDRGALTLRAVAVSDAATIVVTKSHSNTVAVTDVSAADDWDTPEAVENTLSTTYSFSGTYTITESDAGTILFTVTVTSGDSSVTYTYNLLAYVEADTTATLTALSVVQNGSESDYTNTLLKNSFSEETYSYDLTASLSYTGDIIVTPTVYEKASISAASATILADSTDSDTSDTTLATLTESGYEALVSFDEDAVLTIPASCYQSALGRTIEVTYSVQAQDTTVSPITYTVNIAIPALTTITETTTFTTSTGYEYTLPATAQSNMVAYRFGSVIQDEASALKGYFGGLDIIGTGTGTAGTPVWYASSYAQSGFQFVVNVAESESDSGTDYWVAFDSTGAVTGYYKIDFDSVTASQNESDYLYTTDAFTSATGVSVSLTPVMQYEGETAYLALTFTVTNENGSYVRLGSSIDTLIGTVAESTDSANDSVTATKTDNGFTMSGESFVLNVILKNAYGVDDVTRLWDGKYVTTAASGETAYNHMRVFSNDGDELSSGDDSAASFSWDLGTDESYEKTIRITMGAIE